MEYSFTTFALWLHLKEIYWKHYRRSIFRREVIFGKNECSLTLFCRGEGHYCPYDWRSSAVSLWIGLRSPNFLTLFLSMFYKSQKSGFQKKIFCEKYRTLSKISIRGTLLCKNQNFQKKLFFWENIIFLPEYRFYMISALFWGT